MTTTGAPEDEHQQLLDDAVDICTSTLWRDPQATQKQFDQAYAELYKSMRGHSAETLHRVISARLTDNDLFGMLYSGILYWEETILNDYLHLSDLTKVERMSQSDINLYLRAFKHYDGITEMTEGHYPEERARQVRAIFRVTRHMYHNPHNVPDIDLWEEIKIEAEVEWDEIPYIKNDGLRALLLDSTRDREAIVNLITTRSIFDAKALTELLATGPSALSEGNL